MGWDDRCVLATAMGDGASSSSWALTCQSSGCQCTCGDVVMMMDRLLSALLLLLSLVRITDYIPFRIGPTCCRSINAKKAKVKKSD